jgi:hypothetical protein
VINIFLIKGEKSVHMGAKTSHPCETSTQLDEEQLIITRMMTFFA